MRSWLLLGRFVLRTSWENDHTDSAADFGRLRQNVAVIDARIAVLQVVGNGATLCWICINMLSLFSALWSIMTVMEA